MPPVHPRKTHQCGPCTCRGLTMATAHMQDTHGADRAPAEDGTIATCTRGGSHGPYTAITVHAHSPRTRIHPEEIT